MRQQALLFKLLGLGWLTVGLVCLPLGSFQAGGLDWGGQVAQALSGNAGALWHAFHHPLIAVVLLAWGVMGIVLGWNLVRLVSWAQSLAQTMHLLLAVYLVAALMVGSRASTLVSSTTFRTVVIYCSPCKTLTALLSTTNCCADDLSATVTRCALDGPNSVSTSCLA